MTIDGLIILDALGYVVFAVNNVAAQCRRSPRQSIIQSAYTSFPPAYPLLHVDALNSQLATATRAASVDPVIHVNTGNGGSACCHMQVGELRMVASISGDGERRRGQERTNR